MLKEERHQQILNILYAYGKVNVEELTRVFGCSHDTIRRDLSELEEQGIRPNTIRLSVGIEKADDLIAALDTAFEAAE